MGRPTKEKEKLIDAGLRLPSEMHRQLSESAVRNCRSLNQEMQYALKMYLINTPTQEILAAYERELKKGAMNAESDQKAPDSLTKNK
jgi:hypothetical protein